MRDSTHQLSPVLLKRLCELAPGGVRTDVDLSAVSRWRIGGRAACIVAPASEQEAADVLGFLYSEGMPRVILGSTTNLLFSDEGLQAVAVHFGQRMANMSVGHDNVRCEAGKYVPAFARRLASAGFSGAEHVAGIPGTIGGLVCMNGGSQRRGIGENVISIDVVDARGAIKRYSAEDCKFGYRSSIFQSNDEAIIAVDMQFQCRDTPSAIRQRMLAILAERRAKFPQNEPSCGSVFVSDPSMYTKYGPPGAVIQRLGFKGTQVGGARVSPRHANFIVNTGHARATDVLKLATLIRDRVKDSTGYSMRSEGKLVLPNGRIVPLVEEKAS